MKKTTKTAFHRGFTLIELMIVIVILGILMGTILPRLSGAQARARDTGRVADLTSISQALELYFDDFGSYPGTTGTPVCMAVGDASFTFESVFQTYFKADTVPVPDATEIVDLNDNGTADCTGGYAYLALDSGNRSPGAYGLLANVEIATKGNLILNAGGFGANYAAGDTLNDALTAMTDATAMAAAEDADGSVSVFMLTGQE